MQLDFDLVNRVRNVSLAESPSNALLPVFEAISNSVHAIENRFRSSSLASGRIDVAIEVDRKQRVPTVPYCSIKPFNETRCCSRNFSFRKSFS